jgi:hypothetical protein
MFTSGRIAFSILFLLAFTGVLVWSYRKDLKIHKIHYRKAWKVVIGIILVFIILWIFVKLRRFL